MTEEPRPGYWSILDVETIESAPLESLLMWMLTAEVKYKMVVPENFTTKTERELKDWIIQVREKEIEDSGGVRPAALEQFDAARVAEEKQREELDRIVKSCSRFALTELGNSERFLRHYKEDVRYISAFKSWRIWNRNYWKPDETEEIMLRGKFVVRNIPAEADYVDITTGQAKSWEKVMNHSVISQSYNKITAMLNLAKSDVAVIPSVFDSLPMLFNCTNGTFDFENWYFREHRKSDLLSMMSGVEYDEHATCPRWMSHLNLVFGGDQEIIGTFQELCGYSMLQDNPEQLIFILHGDGKNGKSVTVKVLAEVMGSYSKNISPESLMVRRNTDSPRSDIARLVGARMITSAEAEEGMQFAESLIKQLTGGDKMTARELYQKEFEFSPTFKIWLATNHKPKIRGTDTAIWRRILLIPFTVTISDKDRDQNIIPKLITESPGIFNWCLQGLKRYLDNGKLTESKIIRSATEEYRVESNTLQEFFNECCALKEQDNFGVEFSVGAAELYIAYKEYAVACGDDPISQTSFGKKMVGMDGIKRVKVGSGKRYIGIRLKY